MKKQSITLFTLTVLLCACNHSNNDIGWNPRNPEESKKDEIVSNTSTRFISNTVKMNYDDGGILVTKGSGSISFYNLTTGEEVQYTYTGNNYADNPSLNVNGLPVKIEKCEILEEKSGDAWLRIITAEMDSIEIVVTDIDLP